MSAQQVASYLMDFEDHFTSHHFVNIFWTSMLTTVIQVLSAILLNPVAKVVIKLELTLQINLNQKMKMILVTVMLKVSHQIPQVVT